MAQLNTYASDSMEVYAHQLLPQSRFVLLQGGAVLPLHLPIFPEQAFGPQKASCLSDIVHSF